MTWAPTETQKAIFNLLANDTALVALLGGTVYGVSAPYGNPKVFDHVPDNTAFPYVTMRIKPWSDRGNATYEGLECELQIDVWYQPGSTGVAGRGDAAVQAIQKRIDELLHSQSPCVDGWNVLLLRRTFIDIITDADNVTRHGIQRFQLFLGGI